jgi:hypothetical protein
MTEQPELRTERLLLRPFTVADAPVVQQLAGDRDIASTTLNIPHPYEDGMAEGWIGTHQQQFEGGESVIFAVVLHKDGALIGAISLMDIDQQHVKKWGVFEDVEVYAILKGGYEPQLVTRLKADHSPPLDAHEIVGRVQRERESQSFLDDPDNPCKSVKSVSRKSMRR